MGEEDERGMMGVEEGKSGSQGAQVVVVDVVRVVRGQGGRQLRRGCDDTRTRHRRRNTRRGYPA